MRYYAIIISCLGLLAAPEALAQTADAPARVFIPLAASPNIMRSKSSLTSAMPQHFFPLKARPGKLLPQAREMPVQGTPLSGARSIAPSALTPEQASQILSIFSESQ